MNTSAKKPRILFVCTANSARSQMAQALFEHYAKSSYECSSGGLEPGTLHPLTLQVLQEKGVPTAHLEAKSIKPLVGNSYTYVITVCERAEKNCPIFPFAINRESWPFEDPAAATGTPEERLAVFRRVRDQIDQKIRDWLSVKMDSRAALSHG